MTQQASEDSLQQQTLSGCPFHHHFPQPRDAEQPLEPPAGYREIREHEPTLKVSLYNGAKAWMVTKYDDVVDVLGDRRFSSTPSGGYPMFSPGLAVAKVTSGSFLRMDAPQHTAQRRMWTPYFSAKRVAEMRPTIQKIVDEALDKMLAKGAPVNFVSEFALAVPSLVICLLLDVPESDHDFFQEQGSIAVQLGSSPEDIIQAKLAVKEYWARQIEKRERQPGKDIVSELIQNEVLTGRLTREELAEMSTLMLLAGHETTANMIGLGTILLLQHPDQLAALKADPSLVPGAVDECLRYLTIAQNGLGRVASEDVTVGGHTIEAGEGMVALLSAANRDPAIFADPERFDITRPTARKHVAFGAGFHQCIGNPLARAELQIVFETLFRRVPTLHLAEAVADISYKNDNVFFGANEISVAW